jgi:endonuclease/exonuclease/phosphatase family metal-dependent hydrolase
VLALLVLACEGAGSDPARAQDAERVILSATSPAGVPLHPSEQSRQLSGRLPDGAEVEVLRRGDRGWLEVRSESGTRGWIAARYVGSQERESAPPPDAWSSRAACLARLDERAPREPARARLASWNLRWFPDGSSGGPSDTPTDLEWVACLVATLRVDALAVQEIVLHERGRAAVRELVTLLNRHAGGAWRAIFDGCPRDGRQHVGWLVDEARVRVLETRQIDALHSQGGCAQHLLPGSALRLLFGPGLDLWGISVHLDSGQEARDHAHRQASFTALVHASRALAQGDPDVLTLGDLNTMGCAQCASPVTARAELDALDAELAPSLVRVAPEVQCTELYRGHGALLDHAIASRAMRELPRGSRVEVHGPCAQHRCQLPRGVHPPMLDHLSDHCPLVIELDASDLD